MASFKMGKYRREMCLGSMNGTGAPFGGCGFFTLFCLHSDICIYLVVGCGSVFVFSHVRFTLCLPFSLYLF